MAVPDVGVITKESREAYIKELYEKALKGNNEASEQLGLIATGRNDLPLARELIIKLENNNG